MFSERICRAGIILNDSAHAYSRFLRDVPGLGPGKMTFDNRHRCRLIENRRIPLIPVQNILGSPGYREDSLHTRL